MLNGLSMPEMIVVMVIAVLLFGKRLPDLGRPLGRGIIEFKKGLRGMDDGLETATDLSSTRVEPHRPAEPTEFAVPKFEPPTSAPVNQAEYEPQSHRD